jgi:hypothetical protein
VLWGQIDDHLGRLPQMQNDRIRGVLVLGQLIRRLRPFGSHAGEMAIRDGDTLGQHVPVYAHDLSPESIASYPLSMIGPASHQNDRASSQNRW